MKWFQFNRTFANQLWFYIAGPKKITPGSHRMLDFFVGPKIFYLWPNWLLNIHLILTCFFLAHNTHKLMQLPFHTWKASRLAHPSRIQFSSNFGTYHIIAEDLLSIAYLSTVGVLLMTFNWVTNLGNQQVQRKFSDPMDKDTYKYRCAYIH